MTFAMFYKPAPIKHKQRNKNEYDKTLCRTRLLSLQRITNYEFERWLLGFAHTTGNLTLNKEGYHEKISVSHHPTTD